MYEGIFESHYQYKHSSPTSAQQPRIILQVGQREKVKLVGRLTITFDKSHFLLKPEVSTVGPF